MSEIKKEDFDKLSKDLNKSFEDLQKSMDNKASVEDVEAKFAEITDKFGEVVKSEEFGKQQEQLDQISTQIKEFSEGRGKKNMTASEELKSVVESEDWKQINKGKKGFNFELKANNITETLTVTDDSTNNTRVIQEERESGIVRPPRPQLRVWDLVNKASTSSRLIQYTERTSETDGAAMIGTDGSSGNQSDGAWTSKSVELTAISTYGKIHRDMLEDFGAVQAEINEILNFNLAAKRNNQILTGTGAANQLRGLIYSSNPWAKAFNAPTTFEGAIEKANYFDIIRLAILQVVQGANTDYATGFMPSAIVLNPVDAAWFDFEKDEDGNYILPPFSSANGTIIKGIPVVEDPFMTVGTFLVGDFQRANARIRRGIELRVWEQNEDDALNNLVTITATHRLGFFVKSHHQYAFVYGTFASAKSEIDKVTS